MIKPTIKKKFNLDKIEITMEANDCVSHELAVKLKAANFDLKCPAVWHFNGEVWNFIEDYGATFMHPTEIPHWNTSNIWGAHIYSAPALWQAQKWLREKWGLHLNVCVYCDSSDDADGRKCDEWQFWAYDILSTHSGKIKTDCNEQYDSYEAALSAGIESALELVNEKEKL